MPVIQVVDGPTREVYDTVGKIVDIESNRPPGLILHAANELPAGNVADRRGLRVGTGVAELH